MPKEILMCDGNLCVKKPDHWKLFMESGNLLKVLQELTYRTRITFKVSSSKDVLLQAKQKDADQTEMLTR